MIDTGGQFPSGGSVRPKRESVGTILEQVAPVLPGFTVEILAQIDSTNSELMRRAKAGQTAPILLVAEHQTAGRGRLGRTWFDAGAGLKSQDLMFSLGLELAPADWSGLSLAVGIGIAQSLHPQLRLKWPNDLWINGRKLGGILIETAPLAAQPGRYLVIGVGVNILPRDGTGLATPPAGLAELLPGVDASVALGHIALPLVAAIKQFEQSGFAPFQRRFNELDALAGQEVTVSGSNPVSGTAQGVDAMGSLLLQSTAGVVKISSSEVSVRPGGPLTAPAT